MAPFVHITLESTPEKTLPVERREWEVQKHTLIMTLFKNSKFCTEIDVVNFKNKF